MLKDNTVVFYLSDINGYKLHDVPINRLSDVGTVSDTKAANICVKTQPDAAV